MKRALTTLALLFIAATTNAADPDYAAWNALLAKYSNPAKGIDYRALQKSDARTLQALRQRLANVNLKGMTRAEQLAYWINVYNVNVVAAIVEKYPVDSIRDLSTDPIIRLNVFKKPRVPFGRETLSLDDVEHKKIREGFGDPRIHFAVNCAARSCPPIRAEAYVGSRLDAQLDEQARNFLATTKFKRDDDGDLTITVTKIMDWFGEDFSKGGGRIAFIRKYVSPDKQRMIDGAKDVDLEFDDYDWALNDWRR